MNTVDLSNVNILKALHSIVRSAKTRGVLISTVFWHRSADFSHLISTNGAVVWHRSAVLITRAEGARKILGPLTGGGLSSLKSRFSFLECNKSEVHYFQL